MCDCIEKTNKALEEQGFNTFVNYSLSLTGGPNQVLLDTSKIDDKKRGRPITMIASYCPFCGEKYPRDTPQLVNSDQGKG